MVLTKAQWQVLPSQRPPRKAALDIASLSLPPGAPNRETLGAVVVLRNAGAKAAVGVLLRYAVSARIAPVDGGGSTALTTGGGGSWTVPFWLEEARVPRIRAGQEQRFTIRNLHLEPHLRQLLREGFWPTALRLQVMAEPKRGEDPAQKMLDAELPIGWGTGGP